MVGNFITGFLVGALVWGFLVGTLVTGFLVGNLVCGFLVGTLFPGTAPLWELANAIKATTKSARGIMIPKSERCLGIAKGFCEHNIGLVPTKSSRSVA